MTIIILSSNILFNLILNSINLYNLKFYLVCYFILQINNIIINIIIIILPSIHFLRLFITIIIIHIIPPLSLIPSYSVLLEILPQSWIIIMNLICSCFSLIIA